MAQALLIMPSIFDLEGDFAGSPAQPLDHSVHATSDLLTFFHGIAHADVVLVHHGLENNAALTIVRWFKRLNLRQPVIAVGLPPDAAVIVNYYEAGATSYLLTTDVPAVTSSTIHDALDGVSRLDGRVTGALIQRLAHLRRQANEDLVVSEDSPPAIQLDTAAGM